MNKVVFGNLGLLDIYLSDQILISEGNELVLMGKDEYETINKLSSLEYPIYFTYHELLNKISYDKDLSYSKKISYLDTIQTSLDVLIQYIDDYEEENNRICFLIDNIYERYEIIKSQTVYTWGEKAIFLFDELVDGFRTARKYLYFRPSYLTPPLYPLLNLKMNEYLDDSDSEDSYDLDGSEDSDNLDGSEDSDNLDGSGEEESEREPDLVEIDFEGVEYLEDESNSDVYNTSHQLVGKWNDDGNDIIWKSDKFKGIHESDSEKNTLNKLD